MRFFKNVYSSGKARGREKNIRMKLRMGIGLVGVYCIAVPLYGSDPLEIYNAAVLKQRWYRRSGLLIVGFSDSLMNAELLSGEILSDIYNAQGNYDSRRYFTDNDSKEFMIGVSDGEGEK